MSHSQIMFNFHRRKNTHEGVTTQPTTQHIPIASSTPMSITNNSQISNHSITNSSPIIRADSHFQQLSSSPINPNSDFTSNNFHIQIEPTNNNSKKYHSKLLSQDPKNLYQTAENEKSLHDDYYHSNIAPTLSYNRQPVQQNSTCINNNQNTNMRRIWIKRIGHSATTIFVGRYDLVDDLKYMIAQKFPTSLALQFDPSDLIIKLIIPNDSKNIPATVSMSTANSNTLMISKKQQLINSDDSYSPISLTGNMPKPVILNESNKTPLSPQPVHSTKSALLPSENYYNDIHQVNQPKVLVLEPYMVVWSIIDKYFPNGMSMNDALIIEANKSGDLQYNRTQNYQYQYKPIRTDHNSSSSFDMTLMSGPSNKTAILGDSRAPPPRLKSTNALEFHNMQTPQSSAVILFPKDIRNDSKSPLNHENPLIPPPSSPRQLKEDKNPPPIQLSKSHNRTDSSELRRKLNLKVNTNPSIHESISSNSNNNTNDNTLKPPSNDKELLSSTPNSDKTISPQFEEQVTPISKTKLKKSLSDKKKKDKKLGITKILSHINVLVVEDNLVNQKIMARHLKSCNVQFQIASTGKEALEMWKKGGFHLCFMDIQLPVMSGIEVTKEIRRLERLNHIGNLSNDEIFSHIQEQDVLDLSLFRSPIIIVALTASSGASDQQNALAAGCNDFLTKPVQLKWLKNKLTEWGYMQALINYDYFRNESL